MRPSLLKSLRPRSWGWCCKFTRGGVRNLSARTTSPLGPLQAPGNMEAALEAADSGAGVPMGGSVKSGLPPAPAASTFTMSAVQKALASMGVAPPVRVAGTGETSGGSPADASKDASTVRLKVWCMHLGELGWGVGCYGMLRLAGGGGGGRWANFF